MNIALTLGWWIIPAFIPTAIFLRAALFYRKQGNTTTYVGGVALTVIAFLCALLARYL